MSIFEYLFRDQPDMSEMLDVMRLLRASDSGPPRHRSPGYRAHRRWKRARAGGRA